MDIVREVTVIMSIGQRLDEGQELSGPEVSSRRFESMETIVIVGVLIAYFGLMRWVLPRMGVPT